MSLPRAPIRTARLILRPSAATDAARAFEIQSNWNVTRNLRMASFPPDRRETEAWFASHAQEWADGAAYRFAVLHDNWMIGLADIDEIAHSEGDLGYWLEEAAWSRGFGYEAAQALVRFAFDTVQLTALNSGHAADNVNSGRILTKLGFVHVKDGTTFSKSRRSVIEQRSYRLVRGSPSPSVSA
ncbi:MAG: GNAT family N-acetyltransferase [Alphaproteobacteria bacterium]|nr:GNAT family N-acetyltransferase [Alphaproteobacteria bacterium]